MTTDGKREILSYIDGEIGYPPLPDSVHSEEALASVARASPTKRNHSSATKRPAGN
jgi:hypothetical protein